MSVRAFAACSAGLLAGVPAAVRADNCGGLVDCFGSASAAAVAAAAIVAVAAVVVIAATGGAAAVVVAGAEAEGFAAAAAAAGAEAEGVGAAAAAGAGGEGLGAAAADAAAGDAAAASAAPGEFGVTVPGLPADGSLGSLEGTDLGAINAAGGTQNCGYTTAAADDILGGGLPQWAPDAKVTSLGDIQNMVSGGGNWSGATNFGDIGGYLGNAGDGSRGIVYVAQGNEAHVFNAVNNGGQIVAIDTQTSVYGSISNVSSYAGYTNPSTIYFLPTFP